MVPGKTEKTQNKISEMIHLINQANAKANMQMLGGLVDGLVNFKNYYVYADSIKNRSQYVLEVPSISNFNIDDHINAVYSILKDGIETDYIHNIKVKVTWGGDLWCELSYIDLFFTLFMWNGLLKIGAEIRPKHIFWDSTLKRKHIKKFIDKYILTKENKIRISHEDLCMILADDVVWPFSYTESFAYYLASTINNEDDIDLMNANSEYDALMHKSYANIPFDSIKEISDADTKRVSEMIINSKEYIGYDHGLAASFNASEAINPRQYRESRIVIGVKSAYDTVFPVVIDQSFSNGGVN